MKSFMRLVAEFFAALNSYWSFWQHSGGIRSRRAAAFAPIVEPRTKRALAWTASACRDANDNIWLGSRLRLAAVEQRRA